VEIISTTYSRDRDMAGAPRTPSLGKDVARMPLGLQLIRPAVSTEVEGVFSARPK